MSFLNVFSVSQTMKLGWMIGLTLFSFLAGGTAQRIVPGGPFISLTSNILPFFTALIAIGLGFGFLRNGDTGGDTGGDADGDTGGDTSGDAGKRLLAFTLIVLATISISQVLIDVCSFWFYPNARGSLLGR